MPKAEWFLADRCYDADLFRDALKDKGKSPASPAGNRAAGPQSPTNAATNAETGEIMVGRLKDWRRVATRCDTCPIVFLSAVALAATVMFWL